MENLDAAPATKGDIATLEAKMATMATKEGLEALGSKLKGDFVSLEAKMAAKDDLQALNRKFSIELTKTNAQFGLLEERLTGRIDRSHSELVRLIEGFAAETKKVDRRQIIMDYRVDELEKRVRTLEAPH